jgi:hypothetical protein
MINWCKSQCQFGLLPPSDQLYLLEENWKDLFFVGLVQWMVPIHLVDDIQIMANLEKTTNQQQQLSTLDAAFATSTTSINFVDQDEHFLNNYKIFKETFEKVLLLNLDSNELEYFKLIVILRNGIIYFDFLN